MKKDNGYRQKIHLFGILLLASVFFTGCGLFSGLTRTSHKIGQTITGSGDDLRKKVGVTLPKNFSVNVDAPLMEKIRLDFENRLQTTCPNVQWVLPGKENYPGFIRNPVLAPNGEIDNMALVNAGRIAGFQAVLQLSLLNIDVHQYDKGILWFKKTHQTGRLIWSVVIYDIASGAKLLNNSYPNDFKANPDEIDAIREGKLNQVSGLPDAVDRSIQGICEDICKQLRQTVWKGFILQVSEGSVTISSGSGAGLKAGQELTAYHPGEPISGPQSTRFLLQGKPTGKVRVTQVDENQSRAEPIGDISVESGGTVQSR